MTPAARLQALIDMLTEVDEKPRPADALVSAYFRARRYIGSTDRGELSTNLYAVLRHRARLDWWLQKAGAEPSPRLRALAYLLLVPQKEKKTLLALLTGEKFAPAPASPEEKKLLAFLEKHTIDHPDMPQETSLECPPWAFEGMKARFGRRFKREMTALLDAAPLDLRVNPLKIGRDEALAQLKDAGYAARATALSPLGIRLKDRVNLSALPLLKSGALEIQDEGSQLVAPLVEAKPGERVVDFCAGAGGKTLAMAASMENKGRIVACDVLANRLKRSGERFRKAGLHNIETHPLASENDPWVKRHKGGFDRVLVDAPCTGTGTWRRNPDARWKNLGPGLQEIVGLQASILESASRLTKVGGRLVYATCSLLPEENERQIEAFLARHPEFQLLPATSVFPFWKEETAFLSLSPAQNDTDGFFAALLQKVA